MNEKTSKKPISRRRNYKHGYGSYRKYSFFPAGKIQPCNRFNPFYHWRISIIKLEKNISDKIKKNLLDLHYTKYLQYFNTSIIVIFTYLIGLGIALLTKQIDYKNPAQLLLAAVITIMFLGAISILLIKFKGHLKNIPQEIKKLKDV